MDHVDFTALARPFRDGGVNAIALMGSFARGDAGRFSDIDLVRFRETNEIKQDADTHLVNGRFVVVSDVDARETEAWFSNPERATCCIAGVRFARPLWDPKNHFAALKRRADAFIWDASLQTKADSWASDQLVGWIEEVQKGLEGLRTNDEGPMLNARYGLSWGLLNVMRVHRGVLITGENKIHAEVAEVLGRDSPWVRLSRDAFGMARPVSLRDQVEAGLRLYILTVDLLGKALLPKHGPLVEEAVKRIRCNMGSGSNTP